jgi:hypothetical protein
MSYATPSYESVRWHAASHLKSHLTKGLVLHV